MNTELNDFKYIVFYKPFGVLCQFTPEKDSQAKTLADFDLPKEVYAVGRLDKDSEGLLFLTNDGLFNQKVANPNSNKVKTYLAQIENIPCEEQLKTLAKGVKIKDYLTRPCEVKLLAGFEMPARTPPIRERKNIPTSWIELKISEGKNRQVRRMTAAIGHPTLRLIRIGIGNLKLNELNLKPGDWKYINKEEVL